MNNKEIEQLEKKSLHTVKLCNEMKDTVISSKLSDLDKCVKKELKQNEILIIVIKKSNK
jgi:hypothetical protein